MTIDEAINELVPKDNRIQFDYSAFRAGFLEGIKFSQRWISVDDQLPPKDTLVLAKFIIGSASRHMSIRVSKFDGRHFIGESDWCDVIEWKPISIEICED